MPSDSNGFWVVNQPHKIVSRNDNLLSVSVERGDSVIKLRYQPPYLKYIIIFYILGILVYIIVLRKIFFKK